MFRTTESAKKYHGSHIFHYNDSDKYDAIIRDSYVKCLLLSTSIY